MKQDVLRRYERDSQQRIVIDVATDRVEDLYNNYDRNAPYIRRDLDHDLTDYLTGCAREVKSVPFVIRFTLAAPLDEEKVTRVRRSIRTFFHYLQDVESREIGRMFRRAATLFAIGLGILFVAVSVNQYLGPDRSVTANVFAEGLTVAAWVSLWESLAIVLLEWMPHRRNFSLFGRLAQAELRFRTAAQGEAASREGLPAEEPTA